MIFSTIQNVTDVSLLSDLSTPQGKAIEWLINEDGAYLCPNATKLIQRYVLAVMYYSTGGENWMKCSASSIASDNCGGEEPFVNRTRFLSNDNECSWAGIRCSESLCVTQIEFGTFMVFLIIQPLDQFAKIHNPFFTFLFRGQ
jgi:hypothetical protein